MQDLSCLFLEAQRLYRCCQLLSGDVAALVVIEDVEAFLEAQDVVSGQIFCGVNGGIEGGGLLGQGGDLCGANSTERSGDLVDI